MDAVKEFCSSKVGLADRGRVRQKEFLPRIGFDAPPTASEATANP